MYVTVSTIKEDYYGVFLFKGICILFWTLFFRRDYLNPKKFFPSSPLYLLKMEILFWENLTFVMPLEVEEYPSIDLKKNSTTI